MQVKNADGFYFGKFYCLHYNLVVPALYASQCGGDLGDSIYTLFWAQLFYGFNNYRVGGLFSSHGPIVVTAALKYIRLKDKFLLPMQFFFLILVAFCWFQYKEYIFDILYS